MQIYGRTHHKKHVEWQRGGTEHNSLKKVGKQREYVILYSFFWDMNIENPRHLQLLYSLLTSSTGNKNGARVPKLLS